MTYPESKICKLTMDHADKVWSVMGDTTPVCTNLTIEEYLPTMIKSKKFYGRVRVLGSHLNAKLISDLYSLGVSRQIDSLEIGKPDRIFRLSPEESLLKMRTLDLPSYMGGWHAANVQDQISYSVAYLLQTDPNSLEAISLMKQHPLWEYATFVHGIDEASFVHVFSYILDPRWFIDTDRPYRLSKMYSWLGLMSGTQSEEKIKRKERVYSCWASSTAIAEGHDKKKKWDIADEANKLFSNKQEWHMLLRSSQLFIKYIRTAWLDCFYSYPNPWMERILDPDLFFKSEDSSLKFKCHKLK